MKKQPRHGNIVTMPRLFRIYSFIDVLIQDLAMQEPWYEGRTTGRIHV